MEPDKAHPFPAASAERPVKLKLTDVQQVDYPQPEGPKTPRIAFADHRADPAATLDRLRSVRVVLATSVSFSLTGRSALAPGKRMCFIRFHCV